MPRTRPRRKSTTGTAVRSGSGRRARGSSLRSRAACRGARRVSSSNERRARCSWLAVISAASRRYPPSPLEDVQVREVAGAAQTLELDAGVDRAVVVEVGEQVAVVTIGAEHELDLAVHLVLGLMHHLVVVGLVAAEVRASPQELAVVGVGALRR